MILTIEILRDPGSGDTTVTAKIDNMWASGRFETIPTLWTRGTEPHQIAGEAFLRALQAFVWNQVVIMIGKMEPRPEEDS